MTLSVYKTSLSAWKPAKGLSVYKTSLSAWKPAKAAWVYKTSLGAWEQFYTAITITGLPNPMNLNAGVTSQGIQAHGSGSANTTVIGITGGTSPYTISLSKLSGSGHALVSTSGPVDPSIAQVALASDGTAPISATYRLTTTDSNGASVDTDFTVNFS